MSNAQNFISKFQDAILQKSKSLLGSSKSAEFFDTANDMESSEIILSNMRPGRNNIPMLSLES